MEKTKTVNPYGDWRYIGRGATQVTHSYNYRRACDMMDLQAGLLEQAGDAAAGKRLRDAAAAIRKDAREAARPENTFLFSAAAGKMADRTSRDRSTAKTSATVPTTRAPSPAASPTSRPRASRPPSSARSTTSDACTGVARDLRLTATMATKTAPSPTVAGLVERPRLFALLDRGRRGPSPCSAPQPAAARRCCCRRGCVALSCRGRSPGWAWSATRPTRRASGAWSWTRCAAGARSRPTTRWPRSCRPRWAGRRSSWSACSTGSSGCTRPVLLVLDDLHELRSEEALDGLEHLLARAPAQLRTFIVSRRDPKLGLHRLRLVGRAGGDPRRRPASSPPRRRAS